MTTRRPLTEDHCSIAEDGDGDDDKDGDDDDDDGDDVDGDDVVFVISDM